MAASFFFYDLETTSVNPVTGRIMQFAGQRTDTELNPIGEPVNLLVKLAGDVLPDPEAIMITGITPQSTMLEGLTEAEFLKYFWEEVVVPETCFLGYNTIRFDDKFIQQLHYRNMYDPYEWQWQNSCGRWDLLDVVRMTRALRPEGIIWPFTDEGRPTNRLELLTIANDLVHEQAHDALSDVYATIAITKLIKDQQPDLFKYLHEHHTKQQVAALIDSKQPFVYSSGRYPSENLQTTIAIRLIKTPRGEAQVYDLRHDPRPFMKMSPEELVEAWRYKKDRPDDFVRLPVKTLRYNHCPAIAPLGVIKDAATQERINLTLETVNQHLAYLKAGLQDFAITIAKAVELMDIEREREYPQPTQATSENVDTMMYAGEFYSGQDKQTMGAVRAAVPANITNAAKPFRDQRLQQLVPLYKARNFPQALTDDERAAWEAHVTKRLFEGGQNSQLAKYFAKLQELAAGELHSQKEYIIEELQLYGESIMPTDATEQ